MTEKRPIIKIQKFQFIITAESSETDRSVSDGQPGVSYQEVNRGEGTGSYRELLV